MTDRTIMEMFRAVAHYADITPRHIPGCQFEETGLSYCLDCHADFANLVTYLRAQGFTEYPAEIGDRTTRLPEMVGDRYSGSHYV